MIFVISSLILCSRCYRRMYPGLKFISTELVLIPFRFEKKSVFILVLEGQYFLPVLKKKVPASVNSQANLPALEQICHTAEVKSQPALIGPCGHVTGKYDFSTTTTTGSLSR